MADSLYVHIPFCAHICGYCDFAKVYYNESFSLPYLNELKRELEGKNPGKFKTIYVGGGTPSVLNEDELRFLFSFLSPLLGKGGEYSFEANPESLSLDKAKLLSYFGVNRISLGIESTHDKYLKLMGRHHDFPLAKQAVANVKNAGIDNINVDLIYGLPGETMEELKEDIKAISSLPITHFSAYSLTVSKGTSFFNERIKEADEDTLADMYFEIDRELESKGFEHYEISNFAKSGFRSRHNLVYWKDEEYMAVGLGASGYENGIRYTNTKNLSAYLSGKHIAEEEKVSKSDDLSYYLLTNLRLSDGFSLKDFEEKFGKSLEKLCPGYEKPLQEGLLIIEKGRARPSKKGMILLDRMLLDLI